MNTTEMFMQIVTIGIEIIIGGAIILGISATIKYLKSRTASDEMARTLKDVDTAVNAAEQKFFESGEEKKSYVEELLVKMGYILDDEIDALIEASVYKLNTAIAARRVKNLVKDSNEELVSDKDTNEPLIDDTSSAEIIDEVSPEDDIDTEPEGIIDNLGDSEYGIENDETLDDVNEKEHFEPEGTFEITAPEGNILEGSK